MVDGLLSGSNACLGFLHILYMTSKNRPHPYLTTSMQPRPRSMSDLQVCHALIDKSAFTPKLLRDSSLIKRLVNTWDQTGWHATSSLMSSPTSPITYLFIWVYVVCTRLAKECLIGRHVALLARSVQCVYV